MLKIVWNKKQQKNFRLFKTWGAVTSVQWFITKPPLSSEVWTDLMEIPNNPVTCGFVDAQRMRHES